MRYKGRGAPRPRGRRAGASEDAIITQVAAKGPKRASVHVCFDDKGKRLADCKLLTGALD